jgi:hypothetical protein
MFQCALQPVEDFFGLHSTAPLAAKQLTIMRDNKYINVMPPIGIDYTWQTLHVIYVVYTVDICCTWSTCYVVIQILVFYKLC